MTAGAGPEPGTARARLLAMLSPRGGEGWTRVALGVLFLFALGVVVLGLKPGGALPVWIYSSGRTWIALVALAVLLYGVARSLRRRPFVQPARVRALFALTLVIGVSNSPLPYPSSHLGHPSLVPFRLPCEGEWTVLWGGEDAASNRLSMFYPDRRWGLHLVRVEGGRTYRGSGTAAADYFAFGQPVLAPAPGRVVAAAGGQPDRAPGERPREGEPFGNHLVIEVAEGEFLFLTQLQQGSLAVSVGDQVAAGQPLARVGNSGFAPVSPEPHLALHLADSPVPRRGEAIPWTFRDYLTDGRPVARGLPRGGLAADGRLTGQRVEAAGETR